MIAPDVTLGKNCKIDDSTTINNAILGDNIKIAKRCSVFGSPENKLTIGHDTYIGMNSAIIGYVDKISIGDYVSIAQNVYIMSDSGPNNDIMQRVFPHQKGKVKISDLCWIGACSVIMPGVTLGKACVVGANSFVNKSFGDYCVIGGSPAKLIRHLTNEEIAKIEQYLQ